MMKDIWNTIKKSPTEMLDRKIRDKAIKEAKIRLMEAGLTMEEAGLDKSEIIVKEEEDKIRQKIKNAGGVGVLGLLGLDNLLG